MFGIRLSHEPIHGPARLIHVLLVTLVVLLTTFGLFGNRYTLRGRQRYVFSRKYLAYSMLITATFTSIYLHQMYLDYTSSQLHVRDAVKLYSYMNITVAIINFFTQMVMSKRVAELMSKVRLFETLNEIEIDGGTVMRSVGLAMVKVIVFPFIIEMALIWQQQRYEPEVRWTWTLFKLFPMIISNFLNNCYFGAMIIVKNIMNSVNLRLKLQVQQVNLMEKDKQGKHYSKYYRTHRFCAMADEMDMLADKYKIMCVQGKDYMALMSHSIVLSLICHLLGITVGVYNQYYAIAESVIGNKSYDGFGALINLVFLTISVLEIALIAYLSDDLLAQTQWTGAILQEMPLEQVDWRYRQGVHAFTLLIDTIKFRIKPMGLFEIDLSLINSVLSAVASFSLILVQSDLSQRFK